MFSSRQASFFLALKFGFGVGGVGEQYRDSLNLGALSELGRVKIFTHNSHGADHFPLETLLCSYSLLSKCTFYFLYLPCRYLV